jgi:hypothetical protein
MGTETPDVWPRTAEISFGNTEVTRHEFYECFERHDSESESIFEAVSRLPGRSFCIFRVGFKTVKDHIEFLDKFSTKESVVISGKDVRIRVRDRSVNLVRIRIQHFKFDDDLSLLSKRLREYGLVSRIFWDTYQDRSLPKWNGIKTGVVNVDMEIHKNIPSYITFGSYKDPLMVSYPGQMHTCRLCDSPTHVLADCPKQPSRLTTPSTNPVGSNGTRNYSSVLTNRAPIRQTTVRKPQATNQIPIAPTVDAQSFPVLAQRTTPSTAEVPFKAVEDPSSTLDGSGTDTAEDTDAEDPLSVSSEAVPRPASKKKKKESREFRDQEKKSRKKSRVVPSQSTMEELEQILPDIAQLIEVESLTRDVQGSNPGGDVNSFFSISGRDDVPPGAIPQPEPSVPTTVDQEDNEEDREMDVTQLDSVSNPEEGSSFSDSSIQPGQRPLDSQEVSHVSETQESSGIPLGTPPLDIKGKTLRALKLINKNPPKVQNTKPRFKH